MVYAKNDNNPAANNAIPNNTGRGTLCIAPAKRGAIDNAKAVPKRAIATCNPIAKANSLP